MIKVKALQDESGHWYIVPNELVDQFEKLSEQSMDENDPDHYEYENKFMELFSGFMTGGDLNNVQLYIEG